MRKHTVAICPGSFDPVTNGHLDVFARASQLFDEVVVLVAVNRQKKYWFSAAQRVALIEEAVRDLPDADRIKVAQTEGLLVEYLANYGQNLPSSVQTVIVKGVRNSRDWDNESEQAEINLRLDTTVETLLLPTRPQWRVVSSSLVKELVKHGRAVEELVPAGVVAALKKTGF